MHFNLSKCMYIWETGCAVPELGTVFWDFAVKCCCGCFGVKKFELTIANDNEAGRWQMLVSVSGTDE